MIAFRCRLCRIVQNAKYCNFYVSVRVCFSIRTEYAAPTAIFISFCKYQRRTSGIYFPKKKRIGKFDSFIGITVQYEYSWLQFLSPAFLYNLFCAPVRSLAAEVFQPIFKCAILEMKPTCNAATRQPYRWKHMYTTHNGYILLTERNHCHKRLHILTSRPKWPFKNTIRMHTISVLYRSYVYVV